MNPCSKTECEQCHENLYHTVCVDNKISNQPRQTDRQTRVFTFYHVFAKAKEGLCCTPNVCLPMNKIQFLHSAPVVLGFFQLLLLDVRVGQESQKIYFEIAVAWHKKRFFDIEGYLEVTVLKISRISVLGFRCYIQVHFSATISARLVIHGQHLHLDESV